MAAKPDRCRRHPAGRSVVRGLVESNESRCCRTEIAAMSDYVCVAGGRAFPESPLPCDDGSVVVSEIAAGRITRVRPDGVAETVAHTGGGPNGVGRLPDGRLVVAQNGGSGFGIGPWPYDFEVCVQLSRPLGPPDDPLTPVLQ